MTFSEAIRLGLTRATDFKGRSGRAEYWYFFAFQLGLSIVATAIGMAIGLPFLGYIASLVLLVPGVAVAVRRLHDQGKTGWLLLLAIIPLLALYLLILFAQLGHRGTNKYGPPPGTGGGVMATT